MNRQVGNELIVSGIGNVYVQPDTVFISIGSTTEGNNVSTIQAQNTEIINRIIDTILKLGVPNQFIKTEEYRIEPIYEYQDNKQTLTGYRVTHLLQLKIKDISKIGTIIDTAVQNGANVINSIQFTVENEKNFYLQALYQAVLDAQAKAYTLANSYCVHLNPVPFKIEEEQYQTYPLTKMTSFSAVSTSIQPGLNKIEARIKVYYRY